MLIGLPDLVKKKKVIENRDNYFFYISRESPIQNFHITHYYSDGEYRNSFVIAAGDS